MCIKVVQLETEIHDGDWHDAPLRWSVQGPGSELQNFETKKKALKYASIRRKSSDSNAACNAYINSSF